MLRMKLDPKNTQVGQDGDTLEDCETALYNIETDPRQTHRRDDSAVTARLEAEIAHHFVLHDAPAELFAHFDLEHQNTEPAEE